MRKQVRVCAMREKVQLRLNELPPSLLESTALRIRPYCVALLHNCELAGSGTFVQCGEKFGILTARHVPHGGKRPFDFRYGSGDKIGLILMEDRVHEFVLETRYLVCHDIGTPSSQEDAGPDMAFLEIPPCDRLGTLRAGKSFANLTHASDERVSCCEASEGLWAIAHAMDEQTRTITSDDGSSALAIRMWANFTSPDRQYAAGGFDYVEVGAHHTREDGSPGSFGGASGGGLWKVPLRGIRDKNGHLQMVAGDPVLAGVIFYQSALDGDYRRIKCHGPRSLYQRVVEEVCG